MIGMIATGLVLSYVFALGVKFVEHVIEITDQERADRGNK